MQDRRFASVVVLVIAIAVAPLFVRGGVTAAAPGDHRFEPFQFYRELDVVDYGALQIDMVVPPNRLAVIEWVSFHAQSGQCTLAGVLLRPTLQDKGSIHTVVGAMDLGPSGAGRSFGLSQKIKVYSGPGTTVNMFVLPAGAPGSCPGDGLDLTVTGHYERP